MPEIKRSDIPGVVKWDERSVCGYEKRIAKIDTKKYKYKVFVEDDPDKKLPVKKIYYSYCGGVYSNYSSGKLKVAKGRNIKFKAPVGKSEISDSYIRIHKPFAVDLYLTESERNNVNAVDEEFLDIPVSQIINDGSMPVIYTHALDPLSVYYCSGYVEAHEDVSLRDYALQLNQIINSTDKNDLLLYAACSEIEPVNVTSHDSNKDDLTSDFVGYVMDNNMNPFVDIDSFKDALVTVPYARRQVEFNFIIASTSYWERSLKDVIIQFQLLEKVVQNYEHISIKLYMPDSDVYLSQQVEIQLKNIFSGVLPPMLFDVEVIKLSF